MNESIWTQAIDRMMLRIDGTAAQVTEGFPHYADPQTGVWSVSPAGDWTGGFWNGMLWLAYATGRGEKYLELALRWTELLRSRIESETVFRGFLFYYGAALGEILVDNKAAEDLATLGARGLSTQYNQVARVIPLGPAAEEASHVGRGEANIDGVPGGTPLLAWAAGRSGDDRLLRIGVAHALRHIELCVRRDDSVCQSVSFDPESGDLLRRYTHKGITDDSTWTRAQAWAMLGFTTSEIWAPGHPELVEAAMRTADWWIDHVPPDLVAYWDFDADPTSQPPRDTSGTAIAAASLLKLSELTSDRARRTAYRQHAEATVAELVSTYLTPTSSEDTRQPGILTEGCYNNRVDLATANELIWGDYFLFESLQVLAGNLQPALI